MNQQYIDKYKKKLIDTFSFTIEFLNINHLKWYVAGGTCIGTIRHKGLIPWDDDIDIFMPREDYNRLLKLFDKVNNNKDYYLITMDNDPRYPFVFSKICDSHSTILESSHIGTVFGVYVDIFPLDIIDKYNSNDYYQLYLKYKTNYDRSLHVYSKEYIYNMIKNFRVLNIIYIFKDYVWYHRFSKVYYRKLKELENNCKKSSDNIIALLGGIYGVKRDTYDCEWFETVKEAEFEGLKVNIMGGYDYYLKHVYGDYMQLPPENQRVHKHPHVYENLSERLTYAETRERINKGLTEEF